MAQLASKDKEKQEAAAAKNDLESYIIATGGTLDEPSIEQVHACHRVSAQLSLSLRWLWTLQIPGPIFVTPFPGAYSAWGLHACSPVICNVLKTTSDVACNLLSPLNAGTDSLA